jgi:hypothetical protein
VRLLCQSDVALFFWLVNACAGVAQIMGYAMRLVMFAVVVIAGLLGSALAQGNTNQSPVGSTTMGTPQRQAPVGHRQPKAKDLPPNILQNETSPPADKALDKIMDICKGC